MGELAEHRLPQPGEGWRHHNGNLYEIVGIGIDAETGNGSVTYKSYQNYDRDLLYTRRLDIFLGYTEKKDRRFVFEIEPVADLTPLLKAVRHAAETYVILMRREIIPSGDSALSVAFKNLADAIDELNTAQYGTPPSADAEPSINEGETTS